MFFLRTFFSNGFGGSLDIEVEWSLDHEFFKIMSNFDEVSRFAHYAPNDLEMRFTSNKNFLYTRKLLLQVEKCLIDAS